MLKMPAAFALLSIFLIVLAVPSESLKCYQCMDGASCAYGEASSMMDCSGQCVTYRKADEDSSVIRRCCSTACAMEEETRETYSVHRCSDDLCNGIEPDGTVSADGDFNDEPDASVSCYNCSGHSPSCGTDESMVETGCKTCMVYLNVYDGNNVIRRCCKSNCGAPGTIAPYEGRQAYFCSSNKCNGIGAETKLTGEKQSTTTVTMSTTLATTTTALTPTTTTVQTSFSCYDCAGDSQQTCTAKASNCPMCMVYRNDQDPTKFDRRCCWWACGAPNQVSNHAGRPTYFCNADNCNAPGSESVLGYITTTTTASTTPRQTSFQCYDCTGPDCGKEGSTLAMNCPTCMVFRNPDDQTKVERRCCWWACGTPNSVSNYNGRETYFCAADKCNGIGTEWTLRPPVTSATTTTASVTTRTTTSVTRTTTTTSMRTTTTTTSSSAGCTLNCQNGGIPETVDGCFCYCSEYTSGRQCENIDCAQADIDPEVCSLDNQALCEESESFALECRHLCGKC